MTDDRRDNYNDDQYFQRECKAAIWFVVVDGHIQHRCDDAEDDTIEAENRQGDLPVRSLEQIAAIRPKSPRFRKTGVGGRRSLIRTSFAGT